METPLLLKTGGGREQSELIQIGSRQCPLDTQGELPSLLDTYRCWEVRAEGRLGNMGEMSAKGWQQGGLGKDTQSQNDEGSDGGETEGATPPPRPCFPSPRARVFPTSCWESHAQRRIVMSAPPSERPGVDKGAARTASPASTPTPTPSPR